MPRPTPEEQIQFLVKIQRLFSEGGFVATYKFALLQALAALSVEKSEFSEDSLKITTREIAEKFIQYYWRQVSRRCIRSLDLTWRLSDVSLVC